MKKLLAIFALLLTIACSIVLFACEDSKNEVNPDDTITERTINYIIKGDVSVSGDDFPISTKLSCVLVYVKSEDDSLYNLLWDNDYEVEIGTPSESNLVAFDIVLLDKNNKQINYAKELTVSYYTNADVNDYRIFRINQDNQVEELEFSIDETYGGSQTKICFVSTLNYKFVFAKKHVHEFVYYEAKEPTMLGDGTRESYVCYSCRGNQCYDKDYNKIETNVIPTVFRGLVLLINGQEIGDLTVKDDSSVNCIDYNYIENINLKKGDLIEVVSKEDHSIKCRLSESQYGSVLSDNIVLHDIDSASIGFTAWYSNMSIYITNSYESVELKHRGVYYKPDDKGIIEIKNLIVNSQESIYFVCKLYCDSEKSIYREDRHYDVELDENSDSDLIAQWEDYHAGCQIAQAGVYDITLDSKTDKMSIVKVSDVPNSIFNMCLWRNNTGRRLRQNSNNANEAMTDVLVSDAALEYEYFFGNSNASRAGTMTIASDSTQYIELINSDYGFKFLQTGYYNVYINVNAREVRVEYNGSDSTNTKIDLAYEHLISYAYVPLGGEFKETSESGVYEYSQECLIYAYDEVKIFDIENGKLLSRAMNLFDESDEQYLQGSTSNRLYFKKSGLYRFKYHAGSILTIDIELVREITEDEFVSHIALHTKNWVKYMFENPNNENEVCILNQKFDEQTTISAREIFHYYYKDVAFETLDSNSSANASIASGAINITTAGTYNIYVNKLTHEVRIEEVV